MYDSNVKRILGKVTWALTAIGAINWGLVPLGYDLFSIDMIQDSLGVLQDPLYYLIGLAGIYSLVMLFTCTSCD